MMRSWARPKARLPVKAIMNPHTTFSEPLPKKRRIEAAIVAIHGLTPPRRRTARRSTTTARWNAIETAMYGQYEWSPNRFHSTR